MWRTVCCALVLFLWLGAGSALADSLYGTCKRKDGSKVDGTVRVSTSWNGKKAYPKNGHYCLNFGSKVGKRVTVYVNGSTYCTVEVKGDTELNIVVK